MPSPRPYTLRVSSRARRIRLVVTPAEGLVVVLPRGVSRTHADRLVAERAEWIDRALEKVGAHAAHLEATRELPTEVELRATGERFEVAYASGRCRAVERAGELHVFGEDEAAWAGAVDAWLQRAAHRRLGALLAETADAEGLPLGRLTIRSQRTRWGSISRRGNVSLNRGLLFLPPELARYVVLHELVHTLRFDHSPAFWRELTARDPQARAKAHAMREAWRYVPAWATRRA